MVRLEGPYRQSQINDYLACPQALLLKLQGTEPQFRSLSQTRGSAIHRMIHGLHEEGLWNSWQLLFEDIWSEEISRTGPPLNAAPEEIDREYQDWRTAMGNYVEQEHDATILFAELPVRGVLHSRSGREYSVEGIIDQIRPAADGRGYEIYEFKTSATLPALASLQRNIQLCLYCWCAVTGEVCVDGNWLPAKDILPGYLQNCVLYKLVNLIPYKRAGRHGDGSKYQAGDLRGDPRICIPVTSDHLVEGAQAIARIIAAIRAGGFFWNPSSLYGGCEACPYKYACGTSLTAKAQSLPAPALKKVV
ncbi:MAG: PD-(D/E)XK nuclease superfamily protein [Planctomycetes bacterium ADurb.Bin412]|nr:MAG: PD-(D/E)XK nuclease superfamily protein [Planctomycetes bacterium ADurb.Bin412]